eukprot:85614_1
MRVTGIGRYCSSQDRNGRIACHVTMETEQSHIHVTSLMETEQYELKRLKVQGSKSIKRTHLARNSNHHKTKDSSYECLNTIDIHPIARTNKGFIDSSIII